VTKTLRQKIDDAIGSMSNACHNSLDWDVETYRYIEPVFKEAEKKTHPCMVTFEQLPKAQQLKDFIFLAVVRAFKDAAK